jgi:hypothetical protein
MLYAGLHVNRPTQQIKFPVFFPVSGNFRRDGFGGDCFHRQNLCSSAKIFLSAIKKPGSASQFRTFYFGKSFAQAQTSYPLSGRITLRSSRIVLGQVDTEALLAQDRRIAENGVGLQRQSPLRIAGNPTQQGCAGIKGAQ